MMGTIQKYTGKQHFFHLVSAAARLLVSSSKEEVRHISGPLSDSVSSLLEHQDAPLDLFVSLVFCFRCCCFCFFSLWSFHAPGHNNKAATWPSLRLRCLFLGSEEESWLI